MSEQLSFLSSPEPAIRGDQRFDECRRRVPQGCGGRHERGPLFAGLPIAVWVCCADCPSRDELNPTPRRDR